MDAQRLNVAIGPRGLVGLRPWERWLAHAGYVSEGFLYLMVGTFALLATLGARRHPSGPQGVLVTLGLTAPGELLLAVVALGLASYVTWQTLLALRSAEQRLDGGQGNTRFARFARVGPLFSAALNSFVVVEALRVLFGAVHRADAEHVQRRWIARAFDVPLGRYVIGGVGIGIIVYGLFQGFRAVSAHRDDTVDLSQTRVRPLLDVLGIYGLLARGVMFALIGVYLAFAALRRHAHYAVGVAGALATLQQQRPYGNWLLAAVAAGLVAYGFWLIAKEPYRRLGALTRQSRHGR